MQNHARIFPVPEAFPPVDVLIREIDTPGKGSVSVNHGNLPVIPVVQHDREHRNKWIKYLAANPTAFQAHTKIGRQGIHAPDVIVDQPDIQTHPRLLLQNIQNPLPHLAIIDDKILHKNEMLCLLQLCNHFLIELLTYMKIVGPGLPVNWESCQIPNVTRLYGRICADRLQLLPCLRLLRQKLLRICILFHKTAIQTPCQAGFAKQKINHGPGYRHRQNQDRPRQLIGRIDVLAHNPEHRKYAGKLNQYAHNRIFIVQCHDCEQNPAKLQNQCQPDKKHSSEQCFCNLLRELFHLILFHISPMQFFIEKSLVTRTRDFNAH